QLIAIADLGEPVALADAARTRVHASREVVVRRARGDEPAYGINTGFGSFADVKIAPEALGALQLNLLRSHAAGLGAPLPARSILEQMKGSCILEQMNGSRSILKQMNGSRSILKQMNGSRSILKQRGAPRLPVERRRHLPMEREPFRRAEPSPAPKPSSAPA